jgi:hypothetical protein
MIQFISYFDTAHDFASEVIITYTLVSTLTPLLPLLGSCFQQLMFSSLLVPELSPAWTTSF